MTWTIEDSNGNTNEFDSRSEAEAEKEELERMGMDLELIPPNGETAEKTDGGQPQPQPKPDPQKPAEPEVIESNDTTTTDIPENPDIDKDPVEWLPSHFIDTIQGTPTINRKGYCVICSKFDVSVQSEAIVRSSETEFEYAEFEATAVDSDGNEYSGFGTAHIERGDDRFMLNELAETRAMKRAATWATGIGITAIEEMQ
jgi:hypothetical protein